MVVVQRGVGPVGGTQDHCGFVDDDRLGVGEGAGRVVGDGQALRREEIMGGGVLPLGRGAFPRNKINVLIQKDFDADAGVVGFFQRLGELEDRGIGRVGAKDEEVEADDDGGFGLGELALDGGKVGAGGDVFDVVGRDAGGGGGHQETRRREGGPESGKGHDC